MKLRTAVHIAAARISAILLLVILLPACTNFRGSGEAYPDCKQPPENQLVTADVGNPLLIWARRKNNMTGVRVEAGESYKFVLNKYDEWEDASIKADPIMGWQANQGVVAEIFRPLAFLKRHSETPWYALVGYVGDENTTQMFSITSSVAGIRMQASGELILFANDVSSKYDNNCGWAELSVEKL